MDLHIALTIMSVPLFDSSALLVDEWAKDYLNNYVGEWILDERMLE